MREIVFFAVLIGMTLAASADTYVQGHIRKDGTYVEPHHRTNPDPNKFNNWSTQGNVNPYTGRSGTVDPYAPKSNGTLGGSNSLYGGKRW